MNRNWLCVQAQRSWSLIPRLAHAHTLCNPNHEKRVRPKAIIGTDQWLTIDHWDMNFCQRGLVARLILIVVKSTSEGWLSVVENELALKLLKIK
jgi:hypothetical protein